MAEILAESFEGVGYEWGGWTEITDTGCTIDEDNTTPTGIPDGSQCVECYTIDNSNNDAYIRDIDITGSDEPIMYCGFYVYLNNLPSSGAYYDCVGFLDNSYNLVLRIRITENAGSAQVEYTYYDSGYQSGGTTTISLQTWTLIEFQYDTTNNLWEWKKDSVSIGNGTISGTPRIPRTIYFGIITTNSTSAITAYYDDLILDDADWTHPVASGNPHYYYQNQMGGVA